MFTPRLTLNEEEELVEVVRRHWLQATLPLLGIFLLFLVPFFLALPLFRFGIIGAIIFLLILAIAIYLALREYYRWYRTVLVLTTHRLLMLDQRGLFDRGVTEVSYGHLVDTRYRIKGVRQTIGGYGTIQVTAIGLNEPLVVTYVPEPDRVHRLLTVLREQLHVETGSRGPSPSPTYRSSVRDLDE